MKRHLQYHWWKYLLAVLLPVILWCVIFNAVTKPKQNEALRVLYIGDNLDTQRLQDELKAALPQMTDQSLLEITVAQSRPNGLALGELLTARQFEYDILILAQKDCPETVGQSFFSPLPVDAVSSITPYTESVEGKTVSYGIVLSEKTRFASCLTEPADCILFFSRESVNLAGKNGKGNKQDNAALCAAVFLLEETD
ncbi:MAG: hypothetical protein MJ085_05230 [Clostridia bacterium]|nr:hypothetical protein [Clostridia bacterium]